MKNKVLTLTIDDLTSGTVSSAIAGSSNTGNTTVASGGSYAVQEFSAVYTIASLNPTHYSLSCDYGLDLDLDTSGEVSFGSPITMGTAGLTATFTDVQGSGIVTVGDSWTINCAGQTKIVDCKMNTTITSKDNQYSRTEVRYPRRISIINGTSKEMSFNILSNDIELDEYLLDNTNFDLIPIADSDELTYNDIYPLPTPEYLVVQKTEAGNATAAMEIQLLTYFPRVSR